MLFHEKLQKSILFSRNINITIFLLKYYCIQSITFYIKKTCTHGLDNLLSVFLVTFFLQNTQNQHFTKFTPLGTFVICSCVYNCNIDLKPRSVIFK